MNKKAITQYTRKAIISLTATLVGCNVVKEIPNNMEIAALTLTCISSMPYINDCTRDRIG